MGDIRTVFYIFSLKRLGVATGSIEILTPETVRELLQLDPESGKMFWNPRPREAFPNERIWRSWNTRFAGTEALTADNGKGYRYGVVSYQRVYAHRVVWLLTHGEWPQGEIDHIDRNRSNNRPHNLRVVSHVENCANRGLSAANTSGHANISLSSDRQKWCVNKRLAGRKIAIGRYDTLDQAIAARNSFLQEARLSA